MNKTVKNIFWALSALLAIPVYSSERASSERASSEQFGRGGARFSDMYLPVTLHLLKDLKLLGIEPKTDASKGNIKPNTSLYRNALVSFNKAKNAIEEGKLNADQQGRIEVRKDNLLELIRSNAVAKTLDDKAKENVKRISNEIVSILEEPKTNK